MYLVVFKKLITATAQKHSLLRFIVYMLCIVRIKPGQISSNGHIHVSAQLITAFGHREADQRLCFRYTDIVQSLFFLNPKFQASSSFLSLYRPVCVGPGRKPRRPFFSRRGSFIVTQFIQILVYKEQNYLSLCCGNNLEYLGRPE